LVGDVGGGATQSAGRARKKSDERMVTLMESQCSSGMVWYGATRV
jgi:hypothetical protein